MAVGYYIGVHDLFPEGRYIFVTLPRIGSLLPPHKVRVGRAIAVGVHRKLESLHAVVLGQEGGESA